MNVLIGCETSGQLRSRFAALGYRVMSVDLLPADDGASLPFMPKPQYIQPYEFGDDASKKTGLWLDNLPPLPIDPAKRFPGRWVLNPETGKQVERWSNQTDSGQNKLGPSEDRWKLRSETYPGIADAIVKHCDLVLRGFCRDCGATWPHRFGEGRGMCCAQYAEVKP